MTAVREGKFKTPSADEPAERGTLPRIPTAVTRFVALALLTALPGLGLTAAQSDVDAPCVDQREHPLFITSVEPRAGEHVHDDTVITDDRGAFVHAGDELVFEVTIANRVPPSCSPAYDASRSDAVGLEAIYLPAPGWTNQDAIDAGAHTGLSPAAVCGGSIAPGENCTATIELPSPDGATGVVGEPTGEQRVRLVASDDDPGGATAGAERVIVVDAKPDLVPGQLDWETPSDPDERHTVYIGPESVSEFELSVWNEGTFPAWNPNGGVEYTNRSSFDSPNDGDEAPDAGEPVTTFEDPVDEQGAPCAWADDGDGQLDEGEPVCSYRRGRLLDMPIAWAVTKMITGERVEEGVDESEVYSDLDRDLHDKPDALLHVGNDAGAPSREDVIFPALDRSWRAGTYLVTATADHRHGEDASATPELDERDNTAIVPVEVLGVDLALAEHGIQALTDDGPAACTDPADPCTGGTVLELDPSFANVGDPEVDDEEALRDRPWNATVTMTTADGITRIPHTVDGERVIQAHRSQDGELAVPPTTDGQGPVFDEPQRVPTPLDGGPITMVVRLDHPRAYPTATPPVREEGHIAERLDRTTCSTDIDRADNAYCRTLYFTDELAPRVGDVALSGPGVHLEGDVLEVLAGSEVHVTATVEERGPLESVEAVVEDPEGDVQRVPMRAIDRVGGLFEATLTLAGPTGTSTLTVEADDGEHVGTSDPVEFELLPALPDPGVTGLVVSVADEDPLGKTHPALATQMQVDAGLANLGSAPSAPGTSMTVRVCPASESPTAALQNPRCETVAEVSPAPMPAGDETSVSGMWETLDRAGDYDVCAAIHDAGEQFRTGNDARCERLNLRTPRSGIGI